MSEEVALKALSKIDIHEAECSLRYTAIERRLEAGSKRFDKLANGLLIAALVLVVIL